MQYECLKTYVKNISLMKRDDYHTHQFNGRVHHPSSAQPYSCSCTDMRQLCIVTTLLSAYNNVQLFVCHIMKKRLSVSIFRHIQ